MINSIEQILQQPEGKKLEFRRDLSSPKPVMKSFTAFSNSTGGILLAQSKTDSYHQLNFIICAIGSNHALTH